VGFFAFFIAKVLPASDIGFRSFSFANRLKVKINPKKLPKPLLFFFFLVAYMVRLRFPVRSMRKNVCMLSIEAASTEIARYDYKGLIGL
jgi:hypothetical protein